MTCLSLKNKYSTTQKKCSDILINKKRGKKW